MLPYPDNCLSCGLYKDCQTWKMPSAAGHPKENIKAPAFQPPVDVLFVGQNPGREDDRSGEAFVDASGKWLRGWLKGLEGVSYAFTHAVKCHTYEKLGKESIEACRRFLQDDLAYWRPKVVVALGKVALQSVWPSGPNTLNKAKGVHKVGDLHILVMEHPSNHLSRRQDLSNDYDRMMELIDNIVAGRRSMPETRDITICETWEQVLSAAQVLATSKILTIDFETAVNDNDPERLTIWHAKAAPLSVSWTMSGDRTFVFPLDHPQSPFNSLTWEVVNSCWKPFCVKKMDSPNITAGTGVPRSSWKALFTYILTSGPQPKEIVGCNGKYDWNCFEVFYGLLLETLGQGYHDVQFAHYSMDQSYIGQNLGNMAQKHLGMASWWDELETEKALLPAADRSYADFTLGVLCRYNAHDTIATFGLYQLAQSSWDVADSYPWMIRFATAFRRVEMRGIDVDMAHIQAVDEEYTRLYGTTEQRDCEYQTLLEAYPVVHQAKTWGMEQWDIKYHTMMATEQGRIQGDAWALSVLGKRPKEAPLWHTSPGFINALAELTGLETDEFSPKTHSPSYNANILARFAKVDKYTLELLRDVDGNPLVPDGVDWKIDLWRLILKFKKNRTLLTTFIKQFGRYAVDGKVHPSFYLTKVETRSEEGSADTTGVVTGRLAMTDPNMLNVRKIPILLQVFKAPKGYKLWKLDFAQMELRRMADWCKIKFLIEAFERGEDPYTTVATYMWDVEYDKVPKDMRDASKRNTLAKVYLEGAESLAERNKIDIGKVREVEARLNAAMPELEEKVREVFAQVDAGHVFVTEGYGRRRTFKQDEKPSAWNNKIQSECGDICQQKFCELIEACFPEMQGIPTTEIYHSRLLGDCIPFLLVHDAVLLYIPDDERMFERANAVRHLMLDQSTLPLELQVPLGLGIEYGSSWGDLMELEVVEDPNWNVVGYYAKAKKLGECIYVGSKDPDFQWETGEEDDTPF